MDGNKVGDGRIEQTSPVGKFTLDESFEVGEDTGTPVIDEYDAKMPFKFTGGLKRVVIELGKSGLTASETHQIEEANKRVAAVRE